MNNDDTIFFQHAFALALQRRTPQDFEPLHKAALAYVGALREQPKLSPERLEAIRRLEEDIRVAVANFKLTYNL